MANPFPVYCCLVCFLLLLLSFRRNRSEFSQIQGLFQSLFYRIFRVLHTVQSLIFKVLNGFLKPAQKEGFEPSHRYQRSTPFPGEPLQPLGYFCLYQCLTIQLLYKVVLKRRGWDSNPRALSDKRFSRPPRYDRFDTSPNMLF